MEQLIEAKALVNIRPELDANGNPAEIVRAGNIALLTKDELEHYVNIGAVEAPKYKYAPPEEPKRGPGRPKKLEGDDA